MDRLQASLVLGKMNRVVYSQAHAVMLFNASNARKLNQRSRRRYPDGGSVT